MRVHLLFVLIFLFVWGWSCQQPTSKSQVVSLSKVTETADSSIQIFYFHGKRRCPACNRIQQITEETYAKYKQNPIINYYEVDIDNSENMPLAEKYKVTGSSLVVNVKGKPNDLTFEAFALALDEPDSLKILLYDVIAQGLKKQ